MSLITEMHADGTILRQWENGEQDLFSTEEQDQPPADPAVDVPVDHPILEAKRQLAEAYAQKAEAVLIVSALRDPLANLTPSSASTTVRTAILNQRAALDALLGQLETP